MEGLSPKLTYEAPTVEILIIESGGVLVASNTDYHYGGLDENP